MLFSSIGIPATNRLDERHDSFHRDKVHLKKKSMTLCTREMGYHPCSSFPHLLQLNWCAIAETRSSLIRKHPHVSYSHPNPTFTLSSLCACRAVSNESAQLGNPELLTASSFRRLVLVVVQFDGRLRRACFRSAQQYPITLKHFYFFPKH